ncbi:META domain-containing protein [Stakelama tenebrarum]|uniref:META domain-containing protein n=1 Tax=Stakelama tenebrarum TaxID=2711215 RepID=A0A6G6Y790_9SPHN|nr:META domain-containing protein [Sphingosinithalassobacter tenebrarum]QIG80578.1 META domain-containing protein [Sphingosinithalassobacter tenebrarum]
MLPRLIPIAAPFAALIAGGCTMAQPGGAPTPAAPVAVEPYRAIGTEPFWSLTIDADTMRFERPDHPPLVRERPQARVALASQNFATRDMLVQVFSARSCSDGMSDRTYPDTVQVTVNGTRYRGCGGTPAEAATADSSAILDGSWRIVSIAGEAIDDEHATIRFQDGRISASAGCNRMGGSFRFENDRLVTGAMMSTRMACPAPLMARESALSALLGQPLAYSTDAAERLILTAPDGETLVLRPQAPAPRPMR